MKVKFKKVNPDVKHGPEKAHADDAGFDLWCYSVDEDRTRGIVSYGTGIAVEIPEGYVGLLVPRSSVYKVQLQQANGVGVIDSGYRGELVFKYRVVQPHIKRYGIGERIGQLVILPIPEVEMEEVDELSPSDRNTSGFGSTGK